MPEIVVADGAITLLDEEDFAHARFKWHRSSLGYVVRLDGRRVIRLHREVLAAADPRLLAEPHLQPDHINRDKLDNRRSNLRVATNAENGQNRPGHGTSVYRGVTWHSGERYWEAQHRLNGHLYHLGRSKDGLSCARLAEAFRRAHMPFAGLDSTLGDIPPCACKLCLIEVAS